MLPIDTIIAQGESETLEFKPSFNQDVIETAAALANHSSVAMSSCRTGFLGTPRSLCFWITTRSRVREAHPTTINKYDISIVKCSKPRNRLIAQAFYDMGMIEQYGSGIKRVIDACLEAGLPEPEFENFSGGFQIVFKPARASDVHVTPHVTPHVKDLLDAMQNEMSRSDIMGVLGLKDRMHFSREYLQPALEAGFIEMTYPDKPKSTKQTYRLTEKGKLFLKGTEN